MGSLPAASGKAARIASGMGLPRRPSPNHAETQVPAGDATHGSPRWAGGRRTNEWRIDAMAMYAYVAINDRGRRVRGWVEADSPTEANDQVAGLGLIPVRATVSSIPGPEIAEDDAPKRSLSLRRLLGRLPWHKRVGPRDLILFTKQFGTMIRASMPVLRMFEVLETQTSHSRLRHVIRELRDSVQQGRTLHGAFSRHPGVFSALYCSMIRAGETSGALGEVMDRLIYIIDHENKIRAEIKSALTYPIIVVVVLTAAFVVLLTFVVPRFASVFARAGLTLPLPTQICMVMYAFLAHYWLLVIIAVVGTLVALRLYLKTPPGRYTRDLLAIRAPVLGPLFIRAAMSRFASIFAILQASGVGILDSVSILGETIGNAVIAREFDRIGTRLIEGHGIAGPLSEARFFPPMVVNMAAIGEESGNLEEMLREVAQHYDTEVEYATRRLTDAVVPMLTLALAAMIGFFALAIYLPMWDLAKMVR